MTYQERLLGRGPARRCPSSSLRMLRRRGAMRCAPGCCSIDGEPVAYLYCPVRRRHAALRPCRPRSGVRDLSPGSVLQAEALRDLFDDRFARFDFTEGEGQHKRAVRDRRRCLRRPAAAAPDACQSRCARRARRVRPRRWRWPSGWRSAGWRKRLARSAPAGLSPEKGVRGTRLRPSTTGRDAPRAPPAIVLAVRPHGEHGAIVRALTPR